MANGHDLSLAEALKQRTARLHVEAERTGIVRHILRGQASLPAYTLFLRNLLPAYEQLEAGLERHSTAPGVRLIARPAHYRAAALRADLEQLSGAAWRQSVALLPAGRAYGEHVAALAAGDGAGLIAHAYVRYLGDLSGGQIMRRLIERSLALGPDATAFYDFPDIPDLKAYKAAFRAALDDAAHEIAERGPVVEEAATAFRLNIAVSLAVEAAAAPTQDPDRDAAPAPQ